MGGYVAKGKETFGCERVAWKMLVRSVGCVRIKARPLAKSREVNGRDRTESHSRIKGSRYVFGTGCTKSMGKWPNTVGAACARVVCMRAFARCVWLRCAYVAFLSQATYVFRSLNLTWSNADVTTQPSLHAALHTNFPATKRN